MGPKLIDELKRANNIVNNDVKTQPRQRLYWLDAGRGLAAIAVMLYHYQVFLGTVELFKYGYLAVDLFFMMSGYVLVYAYGEKMAEGMSTLRFMVVRIIRLYPTFLFATLFGAAYYVLKILMGADDAPILSDIIAILIQNLFFLPTYIKDVVPNGIFPFSPAAWSLSAEMVLSVLYGLGIWKFREKALVWLIAITFAICVFFALRFGTFDYGFDQKSFHPALFRATAEFSLGVLLYKKFSHIRMKQNWVQPALLSVIMIILVLLKPNWMISIISLGILFPLFLTLQPSRNLTGMSAKVCTELGRISYPVYLLHTPVLLWGAGAFKVFKGDNFEASAPWLGIALMVATIVLSFMVAKLFDEPIRRLLNKYIKRASNMRV